jgi:superfamily I DNA/RNA helicase
MTHTLDTPQQLAALLGEDWTFSPQQWAAVTAPLEPAVVIAGAGSGKTTVMAARVVWLVATGRVAPGEILGLTFTTKATAELQTRIRDNLRKAGLLPERAPRVGDDEEEVEEPTVATYHSYASALLSEHGLRIGHEPDTRLIADASRYQLATRAVQRYTSPVDQLTDSPRHVVQYLLALDAEMSEHLVDPATVREYDARERPRFVDGMATEHRKTYRERNEKAIAAIDKRAELLGLVEAYRGLKAHLGLMDFSDQIALAARLAETCPEVGEVERGKFKVVLLDEYQDTSVAQALMLSRLFSGPAVDSGRGHAVTAVVHETYDDELAWLADRVIATRAAMSEPAWREIGVLTRDNSHAAAVFDALSDREIPVEIVGLKGLLRLPEVSEVVATLTLVQDVTANAALLTLLAGPRWAIGPRDLALLGRRARELAGSQQGGESFADVEAQLRAAVEGADPTEIASLCDALEDPGDLDYSAEARGRFALLAEELRRLRAAIGEPILDLVRRIIDVTGIDVELASSVSPAAAARRDNLDLFVQAVAEFQAVDGQVTLAALLAWLEAEDEFGQGLDVATPSEADSVKLLTVHRAKGLEWDAVFLVGVTERKFPSNRSRSSWLTVPFVMPAALRGDARDLPMLAGHTPEDIAALGKAAKAHEAVEELRLGYVAWTRARHRLAVSAWCWASHLKTGLGPSPYLLATREAMAAWGVEPEAWLEMPPKGSVSPYAAASPDQTWPISHRTAEVDRRIAAAELVRAARPEEPDDLEDMLLLDQVQQWDDEIERLLEEARRDRSPEIEVPLPASLSATSLARLRDDREAFARDLARPMPRPPSPAARFGTRFHAWVEARFGQQLLLDPDELPGRADSAVDDESDLRELVKAFENGAFADRVPHAVEPPFALVLAGQVVRGRIDAVYVEDDGSFLLVDWKTNRTESADPLQLAIYRTAWAELTGVPVDQVRAAFYYVRTGRLVEHDGLPERAELERLLG